MDNSVIPYNQTKITANDNVVDFAAYRASKTADTPVEGFAIAA